MELIQHDGTFQLVKVTLDSGESLEATAGHPFYIQGKGWNVAATLKVGGCASVAQWDYPGRQDGFD